MHKLRFLTGTLILCLAAGLSVAAAQRLMSIQIRDAQVRGAPSPMANITATLPYAAQVSVLEEKSGFARVSCTNGTTGWVHRKALTPKVITLESGQEVASADVSSGEMANATKGFNSQVEAEFKKTHADVNFEWVDKMEKMNIPQDTIRDFLLDGNVQAERPKGGAK